VSGAPLTYVRVDRSALRHNLQAVLARLGGGARLMAVVKANAYGHGLVEAARVFAAEGADWLGVATVGEGLALREAGLRLPIAVFLPAAEEECEPLLRAGLVATVTQREHLQWLETAAQRLATQAGRNGQWAGQPARQCGGYHPADRLAAGPTAHSPLAGEWQLLYGSGLGRSGWVPGTPLPQPAEWPHLRCRGAFAHLDHADYAGLRDAAAVLPPETRLGELAHIAASGAFCESLVAEEPQRLWLDMVRIGTLLYGQYPVGCALAVMLSEEKHLGRDPSLTLRVTDNGAALVLRRTFELRTGIVEVRTLPRRTAIGYGREFVCPAGTRLATLPVGLRHGVGMQPESLAARPQHALRRLLRVRLGRLGTTFQPPCCAVAGRQAPLVGRISLDQCNLDVTDVPAAQLGAEVIVPTRMTTTPADLPRVYVDAEDDAP